MIVVKMELWPGGDETRARGLGTIIIANDGTGTGEVGHYNATASHAGKYFEKRGGEIWKKGRVVNFARSLSPYRLLSRVLKAMGET